MARTFEAGSVATPPSTSAIQQLAHPDHLAVIALLHGLEPVPASQCRVLVVGCVSDEKPTAELDLGNVERVDLLEPRELIGRYDYVIADGFFSRCDQAMQDNVLALCAKHLAPNGVAYISYDTYPGWHVQEGVRDTIRDKSALDLLRFLENRKPGDDGEAMFRRLAHRASEQSSEPPGEDKPLYFHELVAHAALHGLQYLGDAEQQLMELDNLSPEVAARLRRFSANRVELEQYLDFVINRSFRRTLLCRAELELDRAMRPERMRRLYAATSSKPVSPEPDFGAGEVEVFETEMNKAFTSSHPAAKAVIATLAAAWPRALSFDELSAGVSGRIDSADERVIADLLYALFWSGIAELHMIPPRCTGVVSARPRASELARRQAAAGPLVTNQRRRVLRLEDPITRFLLMQLDGTRDRATLLRLLDREVATGRLEIGEQAHPERIPMVLQAVLDHQLRRMAGYALLVE